MKTCKRPCSYTATNIIDGRTEWWLYLLHDQVHSMQVFRLGLSKTGKPLVLCDSRWILHTECNQVLYIIMQYTWRASRSLYFTVFLINSSWTTAWGQVHSWTVTINQCSLLKLQLSRQHKMPHCTRRNCLTCNSWFATCMPARLVKY